MSRPLAGALLLAMAACASHPRVWYREGASERDFRMEQAQCRVVATQTPRMGDGWTDLAMSMQTFNNCMIGKGWEQQPTR